MPSNAHADRYLDLAYEAADGNPSQDFDQSTVENKLGMDEDEKRRTLRDLESRGLLASQGGTRYKLTLPAIHQVEQTRLEDGRDDEVDPRREERGTYVRTLYDLAGGDPEEPVDLATLQDELGFELAVEQRTRAYLEAAGMIETEGTKVVHISESGAEWAAGA